MEEEERGACAGAAAVDDDWRGAGGGDLERCEVFKHCCKRLCNVCIKYQAIRKGLIWPCNGLGRTERANAYDAIIVLVGSAGHKKPRLI